MKHFSGPFFKCKQKPNLVVSEMCKKNLGHIASPPRAKIGQAEVRLHRRMRVHWY